ncbi:MAG: hypothetical protein RJS98_13185, partial [Rhodospirillaceae bacterium]
MSSYTKINYSLRVNKSIERKVISDFFLSISEKFSINRYRYIGFGSMWFTDFSLFHSALSIKDMISIEKTDAHRALYNRPYRFIKILEGLSTDVLPSAVDQDKKCIVWLDYDGTATNSAVLEDLQVLLGNLPTGSFLMITLNAHNQQFDNLKDSDDNKMNRMASLKSFFGSSTPPNISSKSFRRDKFPQVLSR